jgi:hypothetical protein
MRLPAGKQGWQGMRDAEFKTKNSISNNAKGIVPATNQ